MVQRYQTNYLNDVARLSPYIKLTKPAVVLKTNSQTNSQTSGHTRCLTYCQTTHRVQCHQKLLNNDGFKIPPAKLNLNSPRTEFVTIYSLEIFVSRFNDSTRDRPGWEMTV
jgi:hypothetical protein